MTLRMFSSIAALALAFVTEAARAGPRSGYVPATRVAIFLGGDEPGWSTGIRARHPGSLTVKDVVSDVGYAPDVAPAFKSLSQPLGLARELVWSGRSAAQYFIKSTDATADAIRLLLAAARGKEPYLVFNLKVLENRGADLRIGVSCQGTSRKSAGCLTSYVLGRGDLLGDQLWRTYRIPLSAIGQLAPGDVAAFVVESAGRAALRVVLADVRWEAYPRGWSHAESLSEDLLRELTLMEKIGQLALVNHRQGTGEPLLPAEAAELGIGSVFADTEAPPHDEAGQLLIDEPLAWRTLLDSYQRAAMTTRSAIPILFGMDAIHGVALVPGATVFPHNIGMGATGNEELLRTAGRVTATELSALGFRLNFAPNLSVARDERWGRTYESLAESPDWVGRLGSAWIEGHQRPTSIGRGSSAGRAARGERSDPRSVLAMAKQFGGDGASEFRVPPPYCTAFPCSSGASVDRGNTDLALEDLIALHLEPYRQAIQAGLRVVGVSDSSWLNENVTGNPLILTRVLRERFGFQGVVVSDYGAWAKLDPAAPTSSMLRALNAGNDIINLPTEAEYGVLREAVEQGLASGALTQERLDDAVRRVLHVKFELGLFDIPFAQPGLLSSVGSVEHLAVAQQAVRESLVLLKNQARQAGAAPVLPIPRRANVYVAGKASNDIGMQAGGFTERWMGSLGNALPGTTVLEGILESSHGSVVHSADASADMSTSELGVVVVGEYPYAGDCGDVLGTTYYCEFVAVNPPGLVRLNPEVPYPLGLPAPRTLGLSSVSYEYRSPLLGDVPIPISIDPVSDLEVITRVCSRMPCVVVLLSGRPLFIEEGLQQADAFVAGWLPGTQGAALADVLYGNGAADFRGKLRHTWPKTPRDPSAPGTFSPNPELDYVPQNVFVNGLGNLDHVLFQVGHGSSYRR